MFYFFRLRLPYIAWRLKMGESGEMLQRRTSRYHPGEISSGRRATELVLHEVKISPQYDSSYLRGRQGRRICTDRIRTVCLIVSGQINKISALPAVVAHSERQWRNKPAAFGKIQKIGVGLSAGAGGFPMQLKLSRK